MFRLLEEPKHCSIFTCIRTLADEPIPPMRYGSIEPVQKRSRSAISKGSCFTQRYHRITSIRELDWELYVHDYVSFIAAADL